MNHHGWLYCIGVGLLGSFAIIAALVGIVTGIVRFTGYSNSDMIRTLRVLEQWAFLRSSQSR